MNLSIKKGAALVGVLTAVAVPSAFAQEGVTVDQLGLSAAQADAIFGAADTTDSAAAPRSSPGISLGSPVAFGADWGTVGFGVGGATLSATR